MNEKIKCSNCGKDFDFGDDVYQFICPECRVSLVCYCGRVAEITWDVDIEEGLSKPYGWQIECACGEKVETQNRVSLDELDAECRRIITEWKNKSNQASGDLDS